MIATAVCNTLAADAVAALVSAPWKVALIRPGHAGSFGPGTQGYKQLGTDEAEGPGYVKGGAVLRGAKVVERDGSACLDFDMAMWPGGGVSAVGALIYREDTGRAGAVLDFGGTYSAPPGQPFLLPFDCPVRL